MNNPRNYVELLIKNNFSLTKDQNLIKEIEKELANKDRPNLPYWLNLELSNSCLKKKENISTNTHPKKTTLNGRSYSQLKIDELVSKTEKDTLIAAGRQISKSGIQNKLMKQEIELRVLRKSYVAIMVIIKLEEASYKSHYINRFISVNWAVDFSNKDFSATCIYQKSNNTYTWLELKEINNKSKHYQDYGKPIFADTFKYILAQHEFKKNMYSRLFIKGK